MDAVEEGGPDGDEIGDVGQHLPGAHGGGFGGQVCAQAEFFEGHAGQHQHRRSAGLADAVHVVQVGPGILADALLGLFEEILAGAEDGRLGGADLGAGGGPSFLQAAGAHDALSDDGHGAIPLVLGHGEGAGHHAVAAAHALGGIVDDGALRGLHQGPHRADGHAGGHVAVHAEAADIQPGPLLDRGPGVGGGLRLHRPGELVLLLAGAAAGSAVDAAGGVEEKSHAHGFPHPDRRSRRGSHSGSDQ